MGIGFLGKGKRKKEKAKGKGKGKSFSKGYAKDQARAESMSRIAAHGSPQVKAQTRPTGA